MRDIWWFKRLNGKVTAFEKKGLTKCFERTSLTKDLVRAAPESGGCKDDAWPGCQRVHRITFARKEPSKFWHELTCKILGENPLPNISFSPL